MTRFFPVHDGRAVIAPHGNAGGLVHFIAQLRQDRPRLAHRIEPVQARQSKLQRERPEVVALAHGVLRDRAQTLKADQVAMRLGRAHVGGRSQVAQHHRARRRGQRLQQPEAHLDGLDAGAPGIIARVIVCVIARVVPGIVVSRCHA
jgi:hypothetical protein